VRVQNEWGGGEVVWSRERIGVRGGRDMVGVGSALVFPSPPRTPDVEHYRSSLLMSVTINSFGYY
jgi:hypothetical protein